MLFARVNPLTREPDLEWQVHRYPGARRPGTSPLVVRAPLLWILSLGRCSRPRRGPISRRDATRGISPGGSCATTRCSFPSCATAFCRTGEPCSTWAAARAFCCRCSRRRRSSTRPGCGREIGPAPPLNLHLLGIELSERRVRAARCALGERSTGGSRRSASSGIAAVLRQSTMLDVLFYLEKDRAAARARQGCGCARARRPVIGARDRCRRWLRDSR